MTRSRFRRMSVALVVGTLVAGMPVVATAAPSQGRSAAPGVNVCVFYGICVGPALPGR
jgi:hypothetical protein